MYSVHHHFVSQTLSWCQTSGKISFKNFTVIELTHSISRGLQIFRLLLRPGITTHWRRKKRVYLGGLEMGPEKAF